jgi:phosphohistidine phosphatase
MSRAIFLVQHGIAASESEDPRRRLTAAGTDEVERVAAWASRAGIAVRQIRHSGKLRAEQTATILARHLDPPEGIVEAHGLAPNDDVAPVATTLVEEAPGVMLVGHLPFLGRLAGTLTAGDPQSGVVGFRNAGIVCLEGEGDDWTIAWSIVPNLVK